jgi:GWxTD domain-containing protein
MTGVLHPRPGAILLVAAVLWSGAEAGRKQTGSLPIYVDAVVVPGPAGDRTNLFIVVPLAGITVTGPTGGVYITAEFDDGKSPAVTEGWVHRDLSGVLRGEARVLERRHAFALPPGKFRGRVRVEDLESERFGEIRFDLEVPRFSETKLALSGLLFGTCGAGPDRSADPDSIVVPHPSRIYGDRTPSICVEALVVDQLREDADSTYDLRFEVRNRAGETLQTSTMAVSRVGGYGKAVLRPRLDGLVQGEYTLRVDVSFAGERARGEARFEVDASRASLLQDTEMSRTVLGYVATNRERIALDEAPDDSLAGLWGRFWARRDPSAGTKHNEALAEFTKRVEHATREFASMEPGWRSDRGRIYIQFGPPDRMEQVQRQEASRGPTEVWYYYERHATFVFHDIDGFGTYRLAGRRE